MTPEQIVAREEKWGRIAGTIGLVGVTLFILTLLGVVGGEYNELEDLNEQLAAFDEFRDQVLLQRIMVALAVACFAAPLLYLFKAAEARSEQMMSSLAPLCVVGPLILAIAFVVGFFGTEAAAEQFTADPTPPAGTEIEEYAEDTLADQGAGNAYAIMSLIGIFLLALMSFYSSLHAMRTGLLTRFIGILGMSFGVASILFGFPMLILLFGIFSLLIGGWWFGERPEAWAAGRAIPWPDPRAESLVAPPSEEPASPDEFADVGEGEETESTRPSRRDNRKKRKRKQR